MQSLRFLYFILYFCAVSNFFGVVTSVMGEHSRVKSGGIVFDVIYGFISALNFISDVMMIRALKNLTEAKEKLRLFIIWNALTTCACYITDIFQNHFMSRHMKLEKHQLGDLDEASARNSIFYMTVFFSSVVFAVKGGILYAFYQMYENYDQVVANEEARIRGDRSVIANAPAGGYMFQQGNPVGVSTVATTAPTGPMALPAGGYQMAGPGWSAVPGTAPGMPQAPGQPYYIMIQQPYPPGQQQAATATQPQPFPPGGIVYMYNPGAQPQPAVGQPEIDSSTAAAAKTAEVASAESSPEKATTTGTSPTRASSDHNTRGNTANRNSPSSVVHGTGAAEVANAEAAAGKSGNASDAASPEKPHGHKRHRSPPKRMSSSESGSHSD
ncbi:hypothetical protein HPB50_019794 [Hyalomma asiaticum]|uniref:Uncharacterized protein n=1 Tax=Hyalomma asiaticum TaxID=266040 RepID=A0ACB7SFU6_HYAAI|nr:hypothetical protein HPB50_019794 [Hyalomma asiaticum]